MSGLAGTGVLARLALRRDRIMLPAWVYVVTALVAGTAWTFKKVYSPAGRVQLLVSAGHNPALLFLYGRLYGTSVGALTAVRRLGSDLRRGHEHHAGHPAYPGRRGKRRVHGDRPA